MVDGAVKFHLKSNYFAFIQYNTHTTSVAVVVVLDSYYVVRPWTMVDRKLNGPSNVQTDGLVWNRRN